LKAAPRTYGWCRTRWSCATLAATLKAKHGIEVSAETVRRWLHEMGWVWKRATLVAKGVEGLHTVHSPDVTKSVQEPSIFAMLARGGCGMMCLAAPVPARGVEALHHDATRPLGAHSLAKRD
ncbi:MAG: winged helix-turn-helix domain-containing protein, partial [Acidobacteria bacterium]|nr:winged helix-turn-helix domain-containing protein [Acidobacteriota bacterium]